MLSSKELIETLYTQIRMYSLCKYASSQENIKFLVIHLLHVNTTEFYTRFQTSVSRQRANTVFIDKEQKHTPQTRGRKLEIELAQLNASLTIFTPRKPHS